MSHLRSLCSDSNMDVLDFDSKLLRIGADILTPSVTRVINMSIDTGQIPPDWKKAKITPIFKGKGCKSDEGPFQ